MACHKRIQFYFKEKKVYVGTHISYITYEIKETKKITHWSYFNKDAYVNSMFKQQE